MKTCFFVFLSLLFFRCADHPETKTEQTTVDIPELKEEKRQDELQVTASNSFKPAGYDLLDSISGDLNADGIMDYILILKNQNEEKIEEKSDQAPARPMLLVIGKGNRTFELVARNDHVVYCVSCGGQMGDPYQKTSIERGSFSILHSGGSAWRWDHTTTFLYDKKNNDWFLDEVVSTSFHALEPENVEEKRKILLDFGSIRFKEYDPKKLED